MTQSAPTAPVEGSPTLPVDGAVPAPAGAQLAVRATALPDTSPLVGATAERPTISPRTGEVQRPVLVGVGSAALALGAVASVVLLVWSLLTMTGTLTDAGWLVGRINPQGRLGQVLMPLMSAALTVPGAAAAGLGAFWIWNGRRWACWYGVAALALTLLSLLVGGPLSWIAIALTAVGAGVMWLPRVQRHCREQTEHLRRLSQPEHTHVMPERVVYGPVRRFG